MPLVVYNSLTRRKEPFQPIHPGVVGMYVCGPTVYSHSHVGHAKSYVSFDVIVRYLRFLNLKVLYVQNITDVGHLLDDGEDRMLKQSRLERLHPMEIAETITRSYFEDMDALGIVRPDISPRATGHIVEQIELVKRLIAEGFAYEVHGSVYFDVRKFPEYGKLSGRSLDDMLEGTRVEVKSEKRNPQDFALWKRAEESHIMRWPSPWGEGFPGWHLECSAMSMKYLGESFDIHGGGLDNQFPHHECEIAQSQSATRKPFVRYWLHNNLVTVNGQKMSKSLGNFVTLKDLFGKYDPLVVRFFILQSHYRSTLDFSDEALEASKIGFIRLRNEIRRVRELRENCRKLSTFGFFEPVLAKYREDFANAMNDDFNTPKALSVLFDLTAETRVWESAQKLPTEKSFDEVLALFDEFGRHVLGILPREERDRLADGALASSRLVELLIDVRNQARKAKLWSVSDFIRDRLKGLGIGLEDKKEGTVWNRLD